MPHATFFRCHQASIGPRKDFGATRPRSIGEALTATFRGSWKKEAGKQAQAAKGIKMLRKGCKNIEVLILKARISLLESNCWCLEKVRYQSLVAPSQSLTRWADLATMAGAARHHSLKLMHSNNCFQPASFRIDI
jgi:hypothetical protein